ncbi:hypothetical protein OH76DRAFT_1416758 [Lentinus brumalis]|uniref:Uncharacterized protein n=1 Tax=Lentinus brumalis TaxID=2498619 RepID=A0A371DHZ8_9APHY|nr:hypothetical protein OH76DRAFT_1416758 [Polyporus brumalis]
MAVDPDEFGMGGVDVRARRRNFALGLVLGRRSGGDNAPVRSEPEKSWTVTMDTVETTKFAKDKVDRTHDGDNLEDSAARTRGNANTSLGCIRWEEQRGQGRAPPNYVALHERTYNVMRLRGKAYDGHAVAGVGAE